MEIPALNVLAPSGAAAHRTLPAGPALRSADPEVQRAAVAAQFEAILVRQMLGPTLATLLGAERGAAGGIYGDMLTDTIAQELTAGQGLGLGRLLERQLAPRTSLTPSAANLAANPKFPL